MFFYVAINLLMNGAEAMAEVPEGQRRLTMRWGAALPDLIRVEIEDRGTGIPPDAAAQLTEPFFTTKSHGMGLAICKSIVDAHAGTLAFEPGREGGTLVTLQLPSAGARSTPTAPHPAGVAAMADA